MIYAKNGYLVLMLEMRMDLPLDGFPKKEYPH
jgi:hypothetical protein